MASSPSLKTYFVETGFCGSTHDGFPVFGWQTKGRTKGRALRLLRRSLKRSPLVNPVSDRFPFGYSEPVCVVCRNSVLG